MLSSSSSAAVAGPAVVAAPGGAVVFGPVGFVSAGSTAAYVDSAIVRVASDKERGREREKKTFN